MSNFAEWSNKQLTYGNDNAERFYGRREGWLNALKWVYKLWQDCEPLGEILPKEIKELEK